MILVENLCKSYFVKEKGKFWARAQLKEIQAVKNISLKIDRGQVIGLLGINGAGKTTTIKMLTTIISPTSGNIYIDSIDAVKNPFPAKKVINIITGGERNIYWRLTAKENLEYFGSLYSISAKELSARIQNVLDIVHLSDSANIAVENFSKGMKQRLQIARGLINNPTYLFMDEPTLGLDIVMAKELRSYTKKLATEYSKGILLTTHYIEEADELCDYIYLIDRGEIVVEGTPSEIKNKYAETYNTIFKFDHMDESMLSRLKNNEEIISISFNYEDNSICVKSKHDIFPLILVMCNEYKIRLLQATTKETTLEESLLAAIKGGTSI